MKDFRGMKRQRSRNRKPSGHQSNNPNRAYESNGPEGTKVRGNAQTIYEKYQQLARDANSSGDRVLAENHLQHAEHYFRMIRQMQPQRPVSEFLQRDPFASSFDVDFDEDGEGEAPEAETAEAVQGGDDQPGMGDDQPRYDNRDRNGNGNGRDRNNRDNREFRNNNNGNGNGQPRFDNRERNGNGGGNNNANGNGQPRINGDDGDFDGNRRETRRERYERRRQQRLSEQEQNVAVPAAPAYIASTEPVAPRQAAPIEAREPRDADHLPAFLRTPAPAVAAAPEAPAAEVEDAKPKRTRKRKSEDIAAEEAQ